LLEVHGSKVVVDELSQSALLDQPITGEQFAARCRHTPNNRTNSGGLLWAVETQLLELGIQSEFP